MNPSNQSNLANELPSLSLQTDQLFDAIPTPITIIDDQYTVIKANDSFCQLLNLEGKNAPGYHIWSLRNGLLANDQLKQALPNTFSSGRSFSGIQVEGYIPGNGFRIFQVGGRFLNDHDLGRGLILLSIDNIRTRSSYEASDSFEEAEATLILDSLNTSVVVLNNQGDIVKANKAWGLFSLARGGANANDYIGTNYFEVCKQAVKEGDEYAQKAVDGIQSVLNNQTQSFQLEYPCHSPHQKEWYMMRVTYLQGSVTRKAVVAHEDITERKLAEQEVERTNRIFDILARMNKASHETNDENEFLQQACHIMQREETIDLTWIGKAEGENIIVPVAANGIQGEHLNQITLNGDEASNNSNIRQALNHKQAVVESDMSMTLLYNRFPQLVERLDLRLSITLPIILANDEVYGTLTLYTSEENVFTGKEQKALEEVAQDMAAGIDLIRHHNYKIAAERELTKSYNLLAKLTDAVPGVVYRVRVTPAGEQIVDFVSGGIYDLLGVTADEFKNLSDQSWDRIISEDYDYVMTSVYESVKNIAPWEAEFRVQMDNGAIKWIHGASTPEAPREDGTIVFNGIMSDVTERRMAEDKISKLNLELEQRVKERTEELELANKELEAFNYTVSHDLQNPIRSVEIFAKFLHKEFSGQLGDKGQSYIDQINSSVAEMKELIHDLLQLSRIGRNELEKEQVDMHSFFEGIYNDLKQHFPNRNIDWRNGAMPSAKVDRSVIKHVVVNLLNNALKYTAGRDPAVIETGGYHQNGELIYYIKDNGVGFEPRNNHKIFHAFQRFHSSKEYEGTGIGLAIVEKAMERHGGTACAEGEKGKGAIFYFSLPLE